MDLQSQINNLPSNVFLTLTNPGGSVSSTTPQITGTLQKFFQAIVNTTVGIYDEFETLI
jgi:hypothetical protein